MAATDHFRSHARFALDLPVRVRQAPGSVPRDARLVDVSLAGARLECLEELTAGSSLVVEVKTPNLWDPLVLDAWVVWSSRQGTTTVAGLKFVHRSPFTASALFDLLAAREFEAP
jgi:hypothetical protein